MATVKSDLITNKDASPVIRDSSYQAGGHLKAVAALLTVSATIPDGDFVHAFRIPINARVHALLVSAADATTALTADFGIFLDDGDGTYTAKDPNFFASLVDFSGGPFKNLDILDESATNTPTKQTQPLWEALGYADEDAARAVTGGYFIVSMEVTTTGDGGPTTIVLKAEYTE